MVTRQSGEGKKKKDMRSKMENKGCGGVGWNWGCASTARVGDGGRGLGGLDRLLLLVPGPGVEEGDEEVENAVDNGGGREEEDNGEDAERLGKETGMGGSSRAGSCARQEMLISGRRAPSVLLVGDYKSSKRGARGAVKDTERLPPRLSR